jgi:hypothetical protein
MSALPTKPVPPVIATTDGMGGVPRVDEAEGAVNEAEGAVEEAEGAVNEAEDADAEEGWEVDAAMNVDSAMNKSLVPRWACAIPVRADHCYLPRKCVQAASWPFPGDCPVVSS